MYKVNVRGLKPAYFDHKADAELVFNRLFIAYKGLITIERITFNRFMKELTARTNLF